MYKILFAFFVLIDPIFGEKLTFFSNFGTIICIFGKNVVPLRPQRPHRLCRSLLDRK